MFFGNCRYRRQIGQLQRRVCWRLRQDQLGIVTNRRFNVSWVGGVYKTEFHTEATEYFCRQPLGAAINDIGNDRMIARIQKCHEHSINRGHASAEAGRIVPTFQRG